MLTTNRRTLIKQSIASFSFLLLGGLKNAFAEWDTELFQQSTADDLIARLSNNAKLKASDAIHIKAPEIAENGAVVPVSVDASIENVSNISIIVDNNPSPLTSSFEINPQLEAYVSTRVKMAKSSNIIAIVTTTDNQYFTASKSIKVTIGGCGG